MRIAVDIDGTIDENLVFFKAMLDSFDGEVHILTGRSHNDRAATRKELESAGIKFDKLAFVSGWKGKAIYIEDFEIDVLIEDQDEYIKHVPEDVLVLKVRNGGNFDFSRAEWIH